MTERRILVTGGTGYVGTALVPLLARDFPVVVYCQMNFGNSIAETPNVTFVDGDIRDAEHVAQVTRGCTDIIHLAGIVTDELVDMNPAMGMQVNVDGLTGLCKAAKSQGTRRLIYASSSSVYGTQPVVATEETPPQPMTAYARTKLLGEEVANGFASKDLVVVSLRCATCCGPSPRMRLDTIVNVFSKQAYFDGTINVHGGDQYRTNIHVADVAELYRLLLDAPAAKIQRQAFNATAGHHTALELAYMVAEVHPAKVFVDTTKRDPRHYRMDGSKLKRVLGWEPKRTIRQAIEDNLEWFKAGKVEAPDSDIFYNTRRMKAVVQGELR